MFSLRNDLLKSLMYSKIVSFPLGSEGLHSGKIHFDS